jgi:hypothetical protein
VSTNKPLIQRGRKAAKYRGAECLNCGHPLDVSDVYCSYCGQLNTTKQLSIKDFIGEFLSSVFTYDSRLRFTVKDLLFKPGTITRNYVKGQRLKYANPFRFFLSVSIIYFILQSLISTFTNSSQFKVNGSNDRAVIDSILQSKEIVTLNAKGNDEDMKFLKDGLVIDNDTIPYSGGTETAEYNYVSEADLDTLPWVERTVERFTLYRGFYKKHEIKNASQALDSLKHKNTRVNRWLYTKNEVIDRVMDDPYGFGNYLMGKTPFFLFFFTPFFAFFFWLIYSKKRYTYMEHMIFIFHIFSFLFLAMLLSLIPDTIIGNDVFAVILFGLIGPFYFYKALRNFYKEGRLITIIKFVFLNFVFGISATFAALLFFAITAAVY